MILLTNLDILQATMVHHVPTCLILAAWAANEKLSLILRVVWPCPGISTTIMCQSFGRFCTKRKTQDPFQYEMFDFFWDNLGTDWRQTHNRITVTKSTSLFSQLNYLLPTIQGIFLIKENTSGCWSVVDNKILHIRTRSVINSSFEVASTTKTFAPVYSKRKPHNMRM